MATDSRWDGVIVGIGGMDGYSLSLLECFRMIKRDIAEVGVVVLVVLCGAQVHVVVIGQWDCRC